jgi:hypothetical protein
MDAPLCFLPATNGQEFTQHLLLIGRILLCRNSQKDFAASRLLRETEIASCKGAKLLWKDCEPGELEISLTEFRG